MYRDVMRDASGPIIWDAGWRKNTIVGDCRRLLAAFMHGAPTGALGIQGLLVGAGLDAWDLPPGIPPAPATQAALVDAHPFTLPRTSLQLSYLTGSTVSGIPTNRLQILAHLGPNTPSWPDSNHPSAVLREFGLVAQLDSTPVLVNYVRHTAIAKDPSSSLDRTIVLVF